MVQPGGAEGPQRGASAAPRGCRDDVRGRDRHGPARGEGLDDGALARRRFGGRRLSTDCTPEFYGAPNTRAGNLEAQLLRDWGTRLAQIKSDRAFIGNARRLWL